MEILHLLKFKLIMKGAYFGDANVERLDSWLIYLDRYPLLLESERSDFFSYYEKIINSEQYLLYHQ
jgi:hypothetical protein